jgi:hypothetical protein
MRHTVTEAGWDEVDPITAPHASRVTILSISRDPRKFDWLFKKPPILPDKQ